MPNSLVFGFSFIFGALVGLGRDREMDLEYNGFEMTFISRRYLKKCHLTQTYNLLRVQSRLTAHSIKFTVRQKYTLGTI